MLRVDGQRDPSRTSDPGGKGVRIHASVPLGTVNYVNTNQGLGTENITLGI